MVAANYRLDVLGWLAMEELQKEDDEDAYGNYGLHDQRFAMQWTQRNIAAFGGDPDMVTIFGESAGGYSVCQHIVSPASDRLFSQAIVESGDCDGPWMVLDGHDAKIFGDLYAEAVGCGPEKEETAPETAPETASKTSSEKGEKGRVEDESEERGGVGGHVEEGGRDGTKDGEDVKETEKATTTDRADRTRLECMRSKAVDEVMLPYIRWFNPNWPNVSSSVSATSGSNSNGSSGGSSGGDGSSGEGNSSDGNNGGNGNGVGEFIFDTGNGAPERSPERSWAQEWADHMMTKKGGRDVLGLRSWPRPIPPLAPFIAWCAVVDGSKKECVCVCAITCVFEKWHLR